MKKLNKNMRTLQKIPMIFTIAIISIFLLTSCTNECREKEEPIRFVRLEKVSFSKSATDLTFNGVIKEKSTTQLSFRVGGPLTKFDVTIGDHVKKGQTIAVIDQRDYRLQLKTAKAQYRQAKGEYERYTELYKKKKLPQNTLEKLEAGYLMAKAAYENAENALKDTELKAPVSGYIFEKLTENHQTVSPGQSIVSIVNVSKQEAVIHVPASKLNEIHEDRNVYCSVQNAGVSNIPVQLINVAQKAGADKLYEVRFQLDLDPATSIKPGMSAEILIDGYADMPKSIAVPVGSVFHLNGKNYVWVYNSRSSQVQKREILLQKLENKGRITIQAGINKGEQIVTAGIHSLVDNQKVKPIQERSETNTGGLL